MLQVTRESQRGEVRIALKAFLDLVPFPGSWNLHFLNQLRIRIRHDVSK